MRLYWLLAAILLITYGVYYSVRYMISGKQGLTLGKEAMNLSLTNMVAHSEIVKNNWADSPSSSLVFYIFPEIADRTGYVNNEYADVVQIGSKQTLKILIAPDAGRLMVAPAILQIYTTDNNESPEEVEISNLRLQRWNFVVIVKEGRKFTIYINGFVSASHTCTAMPEFDGQPLKIGNPRLKGKVALVSLSPYAMKLDDVRTTLKDTMQKDGSPFLSSDLPSLPQFSMPNLNLCPDGNCFSDKSLSNPMKRWSSSYA